MSCGAALFFDAQTDAAVRGLWQIIEDARLPSHMLKMNFPPHLSIMVCEDTNVQGLRAALPEFIRTHPPLTVSFHSLGVFGGGEGVIYLAPTVDSALLDFHAELWRILERYTLSPHDYYRPEAWVPHVTLDINVPAAQVGAIVNVLSGAVWPKKGVLQELLIAGISDGVPEKPAHFDELLKLRLGS